MPLPPWLNVTPSDFLKATEAGTSAGLQQQQISNQLNESIAHQSHQQLLAQMEMEARKQLAAENQAQRNAQMAFQNQYHNDQINLGTQRFQEAKAIADAKAQDAAQRFAAQQGFASDLRSGVSPDQALYKHPLLSTPSNVAAITRGNHDYGDIQTQELAPGVTAAFRRGSSAIHMFPAGTGRLTEQKVVDQDLKKRYDRLASGLTGYDQKTDANINAQMAAIEKMRIANARGEAVNQQAASPFKEGQTIRNKKDGKMYVVKNGQPVPIDQSVPIDQPQDSGQDETVTPEQ